jgi:hypothetical protein
MIYNKIVSKCNELNVELSQHLLFVSIAEEKLYLFENDTLKRVFDVSTSRNPPSCVENSNGTPTGLHKIDGKIGTDAPLFTVFRGRVACGLVSEQTQEEQAKNLITTRIMRLRGLEEGKNSGGNVDTYNRYVYIHGTNQEDKIGTPNSHGCVLLRNKEVAELFDVVNDGTIVLISME